MHVEGEVETEDTNGVVTRRDRAVSAVAVPARDAADRARCRRSVDFAAAVESVIDSRCAVDAACAARRAATTTSPSTPIRPMPRPRRRRPSRSSAASVRTSRHIFIAAARSLGIPARYVCGYFIAHDGVVEQEAGHAWAEAYVDGLGWVAFDPTNGICATDAHVRVAVGLDYLGAAPVRGTRYRRRRRGAHRARPRRSGRCSRCKVEPHARRSTPL